MKVILGKPLGTYVRPATKLTYSIRLRMFDDLPPSIPLGKFGSSVLTTESHDVNVSSYASITCIDSINTSGVVVNDSTIGYFLWNPYKQQETATLKEPKLRRYNPPKFTKKRPTPPSRVEPVLNSEMDEERRRLLLIRYEDINNDAFERYQKRLRNYESRLAKHRKRLESYNASYSRSIERFKRKMNHYLRKLYTFGGSGFKRLKGRKLYSVGTEFSFFRVSVPVEVLVKRHYVVNNYLWNSTAGVAIYDYADSATTKIAYDAPSLNSSLKHLSSRFDNQLKQQAIRKLSSGSSDGGIMLGEARETARLFIQIFRFLVALKKNPQRFLALKRDLKDLNDLYLTWKFGAQPLIDDLKKLFELLATGIQTAGQVKVKVGLTRSLDREALPLPGGAITVSGQVLITRTYKYEVDSPFKRVLETLGLLNPAAIAWELVPLSFVYDWFHNVGDFLAAQTATSGLTALEAWETIDVRGYGSMGGVVGEFNDSNAWVSHGGTSIFQTSPENGFVLDTHLRTVSFGSGPVRVKIRRRISTDLDIDLPQVKLGDWPLSKLITSISLIYQRIPRLI